MLPAPLHPARSTDRLIFKPVVGITKILGWVRAPNQPTLLELESLLPFEMFQGCESITVILF